MDIYIRYNLILSAVAAMLISFQITTDNTDCSCFADQASISCILVLGVIEFLSGRRLMKIRCILHIVVTFFISVSCYHKIDLIKDILNTPIYASNLPILVIVVLKALLLYSYYEKDNYDMKKKIQVSPEERASFLSRLSFSWVDGLIRKGRKVTLTKEDLPAINSKCMADNVMKHFQPYWEKELRHCAFKKRLHRSSLEARKDVVNANILLALLKAFWTSVLFSILLTIILHSLNYASPWLLKKFIRYIEKGDTDITEGLAFSLALFCLSMSKTLIGNQVDLHNNALQFQFKTGLMASVYSKMLYLSNSARQSSTVGELVNLMSIDAGRFSSMVHWVHQIWMSPCDILVSMYFLRYEVGNSAFAGFAAISIFIPIHWYLARINKQQNVLLTKTKDSRLRYLNEMLNGVKVLKLYAWEEPFEKKILDIRKKEISILKKIGFVNSVSKLVWKVGPFLVSISTFAMFIFGDKSNVLNAEKIFVSLAIFDILSRSMLKLPQCVTGMVVGMVALKRINNFLTKQELDPNAVIRDDNEYAISIVNSTFTWDSSIAPTLNNINIRIPRGSLVAVIGPVGSGKSSLLSAILGDMDKSQGSVNVKGSTAYVSQQAWIQNATIQNNVLFGKDLDILSYENVIDCCSLHDDLKILPLGDQTEIGEKGINLSGGQKQRVNIARAVYQDTDIYLFDDPLSAVDSLVGKCIFERVIGRDGVLSQKTRVLVTHSISFIPKADIIVILENGHVSDCGSFTELISKSNNLTKVLNCQNKMKLNTSSENFKEQESKSNAKEGQCYTKQGRKCTVIKKEDMKIVGTDFNKSGANVESYRGNVLDSYLRLVGKIMCTSIIITFIFSHTTDILSNIWLSQWTSDNVNYTVDINSVSLDQKYYKVAVYGLIGFIQGLLGFIQSALIHTAGISASRKLHQMMLRSVISSPMSFFETNPVGRIVNRFAKDIDVVDWFPLRLRNVLTCVFTLVAVPVVIALNMPYFLVTCVPIIFIYNSIKKYYSPTTKQLKRLETATRSPIYTHFSESINGVSTIRAYKQQRRFKTESRKRIDDFNRCILSKYYVYRWLSVRLEFLSNCSVFCAALFAVFAQKKLSSSIVAMCVTNTLNTTHALNEFMQIFLNTDEDLVSISRIYDYIQKETEAAWRVDGNSVMDWPHSGHVSFRNYSVRYRRDLDLVLRNVSFEIYPGQKSFGRLLQVGIVGRTGAGKSSIAMALFRIIEGTRGSIVIDGIDISAIGLHDLRSKLTIIPQDPVLYSGTLRMNIDPFESHSDASVWTALGQTHLEQFVRSLRNKLNHECTEGGENLSVGQRQLVCLARALLRRTKLIILDEATAAIDIETDEFIQDTIRTQFSSCTVLTIAHRLNTILDYDRIMVLRDGQIIEYEAPFKLLENSHSNFHRMAKDANLI